MPDQPSFVRWSRKLGGQKVCPECETRCKPVQRINGKATRVRKCSHCGAKLSSKLTYPKRTRVHWFVRETDPKTGEIIDHRMPSREIADEYETPEPDPIQRIDTNTIEVDARVHIHEINDELKVELPEDEDYDTVGGFILSAMGKIPSRGEEFQYTNIRFHIMDAEERKINRLRVVVTPDEAPT